MQYVCSPSPTRPSLPRISGVISSSPITVQPPESRVSRGMLYAGALIGKILPSLQMKIEIKGTVGLCSENKAYFVTDRSFPQDLSHDQAVVEEYLNDPLCPPIATYKQ